MFRGVARGKPDATLTDNFGQENSGSARSRVTWRVTDYAAGKPSTGPIKRFLVSRLHVTLTQPRGRLALATALILGMTTLRSQPAVSSSDYIAFRVDAERVLAHLRTRAEWLVGRSRGFRGIAMAARRQADGGPRNERESGEMGAHVAISRHSSVSRTISLREYSPAGFQPATADMSGGC